MLFRKKNTKIVNPDDALPGRAKKMQVPETHYVNGHPMQPPFPGGLEMAMFGLGCFWGAEKKFWLTPGIYTTAVGYAGGFTVNPTYEEVCTGRTGHTETCRIVYDPKIIEYRALLKLFWEVHNPTQGMQQGNDIGTQYRSAVHTYTDEQQELAETSRDEYQKILFNAGLGKITTEILKAPNFYFAEDYHQQYLAKNPSGYCGLEGTGLKLPARYFSQKNKAVTE